MSLESRLANALSTYFKIEKEIEIAPDQFTFQETRKEFDGELTLVVFPLASKLKTRPDLAAEELGKFLFDSQSDIANYNVVKGFLNLSLSDEVLLKTFDASGANERKDAVTKYVVEYSSPNTNKPLHLGHIRNNLLGYSVAEILKANGNEVQKVQIINDRGIHICKSMQAWLAEGGKQTPEAAGIKGDHFVGKYYVAFDKNYRKEQADLIEKGLSADEAKEQATSLLEARELLRKWEANDPEVRALWQKMNDWVYDGFNQTYRALGVDFNKLYYESQTYLLGKEEILAGVEKGIFYQKEDGSVWADLSEDGLDQKILLRSDGTSVYMTQDIGTAILRYEDFQMDAMIYTVGNEQEYHFKVLFLLLKKLGFNWANKCHHLSYGMVDLPSGKMKSREGTVVDADDLIAEVIAAAKERTAELGKIEELGDQERSELYQTLGLGALKYHLLKVDPKKRMLFDPAESIDLQGDTGPFIQYSYARIKSVLRKAGKAQTNFDFRKYTQPLVSAEKSIILLLKSYSSMLKRAAEEFNPSIVAHYCFDLANAYNRFYHDCPILKAEQDDQKEFRLFLSQRCGESLSKALALLGISVPERM